MDELVPSGFLSLRDGTYVTECSAFTSSHNNTAAVEGKPVVMSVLLQSYDHSQ